MFDELPAVSLWWVLLYSKQCMKTYINTLVFSHSILWIFNKNIYENPKLCFHSIILWKRFLKQQPPSTSVVANQQIDNDSLTFVFEWCVVDSYSVAMVDHLSGYILPAGVNLSQQNRAVLITQVKLCLYLNVNVQLKPLYSLICVFAKSNGRRYLNVEIYV